MRQTTSYVMIFALRVILLVIRIAPGPFLRNHHPHSRCSYRPTTEIFTLVVDLAVHRQRTKLNTYWDAFAPGLFETLTALPLKSVRRHFSEFIACVKAVLETYTAPQILGTKTQCEVLKLCERYISASSTASRRGKASNTSLEVLQVQDILATVKAFAERFTPLRDLFGITASGTSCDMLPTLVSGMWDSIL